MTDAGRELLLAILVGVASWYGVRLAQCLDDPYSEPRLTIAAWLDSHRGGDPA